MQNKWLYLLSVLLAVKCVDIQKNRFILFWIELGKIEKKMCKIILYLLLLYFNEK